MKVYGIVGKIGSGKTKLLELAAREGYPIFNADYEVAQLYKDPSIQSTIRKLLKLEEEGDLKKQLVERLKTNPEALRELERISHPLIERKIVDFINNKSASSAFLEVPLLYEAGLDKYCDKVILIEAGEEVRQKRVGERENKVIAQILESRQEDISSKKLKADFIIYNNEDENSLLNQFKNVIKSNNL